MGSCTLRFSAALMVKRSKSVKHVRMFQLSQMQKVVILFMEYRKKKESGSPAQVVMIVNLPPSPNPSHKGRGMAISLSLQDYQ